MSRMDSQELSRMCSLECVPFRILVSEECWEQGEPKTGQEWEQSFVRNSFKRWRVFPLEELESS